MGVSMNTSFSQWVVAAKYHVSRTDLDLLRRVQRSASDVCMGVDESNGGTFAIVVIADLRHHRRHCRMEGGQHRDNVHNFCSSL